MNTSRTRALVLVGGALLLATAAGCSSTESAKPSKAHAEPSPQTTITERPRLGPSAAEQYGLEGARANDFYDELEKRDLVSEDDALHGVLLLVKGKSPGTYVQRVAIAKKAGLIDTDVNRQPRDATTVGEVADMLSRAMTPGANRPAQPASALERLKQMGVMEEGWRASRGLTGSEMLTVLRAAEGKVPKDVETADQGSHQ